MIVVGFLIGTPTFITKHGEYVSWLTREYRGLGDAARGGKYGNTQSWFLDYFFSKTPSWFEPYTINSLWGAMGVPLLILSSCAFVYFIYRARSEKGAQRIIYLDFLLFGWLRGGGWNSLTSVDSAGSTLADSADSMGAGSVWSGISTIGE